MARTRGTAFPAARRGYRCTAGSSSVHGGVGRQRATLLLLAVAILTVLGATLVVPFGSSGTSAIVPIVLLRPEGTNLANLTVTPNASYVDTPVNASGSGYAPNAPLLLTFNASEINACNIGSNSSNSTGSFSCVFTVPEVPAGTYPVNATDGTNNGTFNFTVLPPQLSVAPTSGTGGSTVALNGSEFYVSTSYLYCFQSMQVACSSGSSFTTGSDGSIPGATTITVPSVSSGSYFVDVSLNGSLVASAAFLVTSVSLLLSPTHGHVGTSIDLSGSGLTASTTYSYCLQTESAACPADTATSFTSTGSGDVPGGTSVAVPAEPAGLYNVDVSKSTALVGLAVFNLTANVGLTPGSGEVGSLVIANGTGMAADNSFSVTWNVSTTVCSGNSTDADGNFSCQFIVPAAAGGETTVTASDGTNLPSAQFFVEPSVTATPGQGYVGAAVEITGAGFAGTTAFTVKWNASATLCASTTSAEGAFGCSIALPASPEGPHTVVGTAGTSASAQITILPSLRLSLSSGTVGTSVTATGEGFDADAAYNVTWNLTVTLCTGSTLSDGALSCAFSVPAAPGGVHSISAVENLNSATAGFTVAPFLQISETSGFVGSSDSVTGIGFGGTSPYSLTWDSTTVLCADTTDPSGNFGCTFTVPAAPAGAHSIAAVGSMSAPSVGFTVTPYLSLSVVVGPPGTSVTASGTGFGATSSATVGWTGGAALCAETTESNGSFVCRFTLPATPAGSGTIAGIQGSNQADVGFVVTPAFTLSPTGAAVGALVTVSGVGFDASSTYLVGWNASSTQLCSGNTSALGSFSCTFQVPTVVAGVAIITVSEGAHGPTVLFNVLPAPPPGPASASPFPWWEVVVAIAIVIAALLVAGLVYEQRRHGGRPRPPRPARAKTPGPWEEEAATGSRVAVVAPAGIPGTELDSDAVPPAVPTSSATATPEPEDIDALIARLERMSVEMFKKTPKQLGEQASVSESNDVPKDPS